ncbi:phage terminase large subunit [Parabacteroides sp. AF17-3]|uniref:phage terminase large subunit n=1 Tax=Parabacteroides sp. AF17-3 TaxID=2293113 RepID=UPI00351A871B
MKCIMSNHYRFLNAYHKTIPDELVQSCLQDRKDFVRGLLYEASYTTNGEYEFISRSEEFANKLAYILRSLGAIACIKPIKKKTKVIKYYIRFSFDPRSNILKHGPQIPVHKRYIRSIEELDEPVECRCITLDSEEQLYITDDFLVTHNSYVGSAWLVSSCMRFPNIRAVVARKTIKSLKESTFITIKKVMKEWGLKEDENFCINNIEGTITFWNESVIMMKEMADLPADLDFSRFGSMEATIVFVDEASEISERAADVMFSRIRWKTSETFKTPKMFLSCNPAACWLRDRFVQDEEGNPVECRDGEVFIRFSIFDNPDEQFRQIYESSLNKIKDNATRERLLYGNWDFIEANAMTLYKGFSGDKHLVTNLKESVYDPMKPLILGFDFNVFPHMSCEAVQIDWENKNVYFLEEFLGKPKEKLNNTPKFAQYIKGKLLEQKHIGGIILTGDPAGLARSTQTEDGVNNFTIIQANLDQTILRPRQNILSKQPPQKNRIDWINELFDGLDGWNIYIDLRCRKLTEDLVYQLRNEDGTKNKQKVTDPVTKVRYERFGHNSDCLDYILCTFLSKSWSKYQRGGQTGPLLTTTIIQPQFTY